MMTANLCKDCLHWHQESTYIRKKDGLRTRHGFCDRTGGACYEPDEKDTLAFCAAQQGEFSCFLSCDEDFGCVQFEAKK